MTLIPGAGDFDNGALDTYQAPSFFDIPEAEEDQKDDVAAQLAEMKANQARLESELKAAREKSIPSNFQDTYQPPANPQPAPRADNPEFKKQLADGFFADPGQMLQNVLVAAQQNAEEVARKRYIPVAAMAVRSQIQYFKQGAGMAPEVAKEFDALINSIPDEQLASAQPQQIASYLEGVRKQAQGEALDKGWIPNSQSNNIPMYGGSTPSAPLKPNHKRMKLTADQAAALAEIESNPYYKTWTQAQKLEAIKDF